MVPNDRVLSGQVLFQLERTAIRNRQELAEQALKVAQTELLKARQMAYGDLESREAMPILTAQIKQRASEFAYSQERLKRATVRAERAGVAIFSDPERWQGKPVVVGERIMIIADPSQVELDIRLPVDDAIILEPGAEVRFFLNVAPLKPLTARLEFAGYDAIMTPEGFLAYPLKARFSEETTPPRPGLRGSAKILGKQVSLFYYLLRRPLAYFRRIIGF